MPNLSLLAQALSPDELEWLSRMLNEEAEEKRCETELR
jgi:hypothetical protein